MASPIDIEEELLVPDSSNGDIGHHETIVPESTNLPNRSINSSWNSSSYLSAVLLMIALSSTGVALAVVPIMIPTDEVFLVTLRTAEVIVRATFGFAIIAICSGYIYMRFKSTDIFASQEYDPTFSLSGNWLAAARTPRSLSTKYMLITLFVFGTGTILSCILYIVQYSLEHKFLGVIDNIVYIFILCFQLTFFYYYEGEVLYNRSIFHYTIAIMVGAEVWAWVGETLWPLWIFDWAGNTTDSGHTNITDLPSVLEFSKEFLEPFYVEFATIAISILFHLWHTISENKAPSNNTSEQCNREPRSLKYPITDPTANDICRSQSTIQDNVNSPDNNCTSLHRKLMILSGLLSTVLGLLYVVICELTNLNQIIFPYYVEIILYRFLKLVYFTILCILSTLLLFKLRQFQIHNYPLNSSEYVLLLGTCSDSIYYFLRIVASIGYLTLDSTTDTKSSTAWLYLIYSFVAIFQIWIQTKLFLIVRRKHIPRYVKYVLVFISAINFAEWFQRGLHLGISKHGASETVTSPIMDQFFGDTSTRILRLLLLPVMILYRFHSGMVAVELIHEH
ncbi:uncharacterized protein [Amphiura filiformis]|uniref:uncharacterized protein n=1 Tax=Amphiura filiformis TaxID=82378 RepID=UPI003B221DEC